MADQLASRGGTREFEYGEQWHRHFRFEIPVRRPEVWGAEETTRKLSHALHVLSDDDFEFHFTKDKNPRPYAMHLPDPSDRESDFEEVALFSGGLDSLCGAVQEILQGQRRIVLVSHRSANKVYARQQRLVKAITDRVAERSCAPLHVPVGINKQTNLGDENTQRTRSFLFASLAAVVANTLNRTRIRFYENGITSLNLPINEQVTGARATRTTHPRTLTGFAALFSHLFDTDFAVENPFQWKTKTEILRELHTSGNGDLCRRACSCTHTITSNNKHTHCGKCSQCVDRWLTARAAGLNDAEDPGDKYELSMLMGQREGMDYTLVESYVRTCRQIERMKNPLEFFRRFGETARALMHVALPAKEAAKRIFDLYKRHAAHICRALAEINAQHTHDVVRMNYPAHSLLGVIVGRIPTVEIEAQDNEDDSVDKPVANRETFTIEFLGRSFKLGLTKEFAVFERLNRSLGKYLPIGTLISDVWNDKYVEKNTVQRTISNLRRVLHERFGDRLLLDGKSAPGHYALKIADHN